MDGTNPFETDLERGPANHVPLSPLSFLPRAAAVYPGRCAVVHGETRYRSEEHTSELQSLMRISYAVFCLKKKNKKYPTAKTRQRETLNRHNITAHIDKIQQR